MDFPFRWRQNGENSIHMTLEVFFDGKHRPVPMVSYDGKTLLNEHPAKTQRKAKSKTTNPSFVASSEWKTVLTESQLLAHSEKRYDEICLTDEQKESLGERMSCWIESPSFFAQSKWCN